MKPDEVRLLLAVADGAGRSNGHVTPRDAGDAAGMPYKRVCYLCEKWARKKWYDYGVSVDLGWLTAAGLAAAAELRDTGPS